jgi:hypothetical protein
MNYTVYDAVTGQIQRVFTSQDSDLVQHNLKDCVWIEGNYSSVDYYIADGNAVIKPAKPDLLGQVFDFDYATKTWKINLVRSQTASRQHRDQLLSQVDRVNPIWYGSLTSQQQSELAQYRQCLLDVPQQPGWPESVTWPRVPTWL